MPLLTAPELGHTALSFMHGGVSLHSSLVHSRTGNFTS
nr:MAG TPA: hypothetical protein [Caudoviricetes sp.]